MPGVDTRHEVMKWTIGVDIGGTFTDAVMLASDGASFYSKVPTTPNNLAEGVINSLGVLAGEAKITLDELLSNTVRFAHGTTATVNAVVQRRGARVGLITTKGFKDTLLVAKGGRGVGLEEEERMRFSKVSMPEPLVPYALTEEVTERVDYKGRVLVPLDTTELLGFSDRLVQKGVESIAICFLWSFLNPVNEQQAKRIITEAHPRLRVTNSSEIMPILGEYERMTTTVMNCYLAPILGRYVDSLESGLRMRGLEVPLLLMQSSGGLMPASSAPGRAVTTLVSGLAAGVIASNYMASTLGIRNAITTDMGGTSFEVGMIYDGMPQLSADSMAPKMGPYMGRWHLAVPTIDITAIGTASGSIAWVDKSVLKVGPVSAGADPGPACFDKGGTEPTLTDADLVLGYLNPEYILGGRLRVNKGLSSSAIKNKIAVPLGMDTIDAAKGIYKIANNQIANLTRKVTIERGYDPRDFVMISFGGAGPMHCGAYGMDLGVQKILIPGKGLATAHSALGTIVSDLKVFHLVSDYVRMPTSPKVLNEHYNRMEKAASEALKEWGVEDKDSTLIRSADMKYRLQKNVLTIPVPGGELDGVDLERIVIGFEEKYELLFGEGTGYPEGGIDFANFRVEGVGKSAKPPMRTYERNGPDPAQASKGNRDVFFLDSDDFISTRIYDGDRLRSGNVVDGPAVIEYSGTTIVVNPKQTAETDEFLNVSLRTKASFK